MAKISSLLIAVICILPALALATRPVQKNNHKFCVRGRVYCDPCRAGFETPASTYLEGAKVKLQCRERNTQKVLYEDDAVTDATGTYKIYVDKDQKNNVCDTILVSSPHRRCKLADPGRDRSRVTLTSNNGIVSSERYANNLGFWMAEPMSFCAKLMKQYELTEDEV
ncbi:major pollen allergen Lol p 11-like [Silene latifolia]|uniref:major pollen allergen Lol p 11-like n=1 Tax=Silene latifolia TaxID=37657 RepID=UPI003D7882E5